MLGTHALGAAIDLLLEVGPERIEARLLKLTDRLAAGLRARGAEIVSPWGAGERSGIVVFRLGDVPEAPCAQLIGQGFIVRVRSAGIRVARISATTKATSPAPRRPGSAAPLTRIVHQVSGAKRNGVHLS